MSYRINTTRLNLRLIRENDADYLIDLESDIDVQQFSSLGPKNVDQTIALVKDLVLDYETTGLPCFLVFHRCSKDFLGRTIFMLSEGQIEVGYSLHKKYWGQGFATEMLTALLEWARKHIFTDYIYACSHSGNLGSLRVLEKCGMQKYKTELTKDNGYYHFYRRKNS